MSKYISWLLFKATVENKLRTTKSIYADGEPEFRLPTAYD
jgi:hypothetical protein